ncbi:metallophosphoesterase [Vibrio sp. PNB22_3_1]
MAMKRLCRDLVLWGGSDFHLEHYVRLNDFDVSVLMPRVDLDPRDYNVCLLAGDIAVPKKTGRYVQWFEAFCSSFDLIIYLPGNHEHWRGAYGDNFRRLGRACVHIENLRFVEREVVPIELQGVKLNVVAATLWSDLSQNADEVNQRLASVAYRNADVLDFSEILQVRSNSKKIGVGEYQSWFRCDLAFVESAMCALVGEDSVNILMTHHSPTRESLVAYSSRKPEYDAFDATELSTILQSGVFDVAFHGHIHREVPFERKVGQTWVKSNPCGYMELHDKTSPYRLMEVVRLSLG